MDETSDSKDRYAGDAAWREWFDVCAVSRCADGSAERLRRQISAAMYAQLARCGISRSDAGEDDPVAVFDSYFMLKGSRDAKKPLKSYFAHRIRVEGVRLVDFVCGTLFGAGSGRIHDIVTDWIAAIKGWRIRTLRDGEGRRCAVWECAGVEDRTELELEDDSDIFADLMDVGPMEKMAADLLESLAKKIKVEKGKVALLCYVTAQDIPLLEAAVLEGLGTAKSRAYALREKTMATLSSELRKIESGNDPLFVRVLLETCETLIPETVRAKLGGRNEDE